MSNGKIEPSGSANDLSRRVIGLCIEIHRQLGPGLLESMYEECLAHELTIGGIPFQRQMDMPVVYKTLRLDGAYRIDFLINAELIVELKSVSELLPVHEAQVLTYLRLSRVSLGLLVNFNVPVLKQGIKRLVLSPVAHP